MSEVDQRVNPRFTRRLHRSREMGVVHGEVALLRQELRLNNVDYFGPLSFYFKLHVIGRTEAAI